MTKTPNIKKVKVTVEEHIERLKKEVRRRESLPKGLIKLPDDYVKVVKDELAIYEAIIDRFKESLGK